MNRLFTFRNQQGRFRWRNLLFLYIILLVASQVIRWQQQAGSPSQSAGRAARISFSTGPKSQVTDLEIPYVASGPENGSRRTPVLLIDGLSPAATPIFTFLASRMSPAGPVYTPDLGAMDKAGVDLSARSQAAALLSLMDHLDIAAAHLVAFQMGGPVAVQMAERAPQRVKSLTMAAAVGVQEFDLLGNHHINRGLYAAQLALLWLTQNAIPHMGLLDPLDAHRLLAKVRVHSDLRPIRGYLTDFQAPALIFDNSVRRKIPAASRELHRIIPQSRLWTFRSKVPSNQISESLAVPVDRFIEQVEQGRAASRSTAAADRVARAAIPLSQIQLDPLQGRALFLVILLLAAATLVSEDLTCIGAGLLVARGTIGFLPAVIASFSGILIGDILLFLSGRVFGRPALRVPPFKWWVTETDIQRTSDWFSAKGPVIIITSRFMPGLRLPTYFAAGVLRTRLGQFVSYFTVAVALWTPMLVGLSAAVGNRMFAYYDLFGRYALLILIATVALLWAIPRLIVPLFSWRGRRLLLSLYRRVTRWEFWPPTVFYLPVVCYYFYLSLRYRSFTLFTACNPGIPEGGFREESKSRILDNLKNAGEFVARYCLIHGRGDSEEKIRQAKAFLQRSDLSYPVVLKPDIGQRGEGVTVIRSDQQLADRLSETQSDHILQEYAPGREFGVFYYRYPDKETGRVFSITDKRLLSLTGDGTSSLEQLILRDDRAVCMAHFHFRRHREELYRVLKKGEAFDLVEVGTHCRGALFLDGSQIRTSEMEAAFDRVSKHFNGFYFGRYDVKTPSVEDFRRGRNFKIVELNGVTSEATHIYHPGTRLWKAYGVLMRQWRLAFEIGAINRRRGHKPATAKKMLGLLVRLATGRQPPAEQGSK